MPAPSDQQRIANAIPNPFEETPPRLAEYTAQEIATLQSRLDRQLGPEYISTRPGAGGGKVHYLAAEKVINLANEVFGFNGWSSAIQNVQIDFVDESQSTGKITLGLSIIVRVTLKDGTFHEDIGYGHIENCKGKAAAFEKAKKEAATDALKRALRNFGNVLGNCLYDKDYLARITKIKVAPSKWDAENLHRHPDFAPIKREAIADGPTESSTEPARVPAIQSHVSTGTEYEDEFGGNLFDEVDFAVGHPDEVVLDASMADISTDVSENRPDERPPHAAPPPQRRQSVPRVQSMPASRPLNSNPPQQMQQQRQQAQQKGPQTPNGNQPGRERIPPQANNSRFNQPPNHVPSNNASNQHQPARATPPSVTDLGLQNSVQVSSDDGRPKDIPPPGHEPPIGFVTSRAAELLQQTDATNVPIPPNVPVFNPHAESPSLRRTNGINHNKSAPVSRQAVGNGNGPANGNNAPVPAPRTNFINPAADINRRIGMPNAGQSPLANRTSYKAPGPAGGKRGPEAVTRPPLADVSNIQADGGGVDGVEAKRAKVDNP